jgi:Rieske Fe-S protein
MSSRKQKDDKVSLSKEESSKLLASEGSLLVEPKGSRVKILVVHAKDGSMSLRAQRGNLHAVSAICTHMGCTVLYDEKLGHIRCPCHGSQYGLDGHNIKGPAMRPLKPYEVRNNNGQVVIVL